MNSGNRKGKVYLVGAGPGDPGLITVRGMECLLCADVIIYDYLANTSLLELAGGNTELIYVGKKAGSHTMSQGDINSLIIERAQKQQVVVRLKGGDPFVFGRGGEEAGELVKAGLDFEVVPGVSSAIAVPAYAGIPLTHRDYTSTAAFITGHEKPGKGESNIAWDKIATGAGTLVFLMGVGNLSGITERLIRNGRSPDTPVAVICKGTLVDQITVVGTLQNIARLSRENNVRPPAVIVVGDVVALREDLKWFEKRPLFGKKIVITRPKEQAKGFVKALSLLGAECIEFPTIELAPPESWDALDHAIESITGYQWLVFTSVNGVKYFLRRLELSGRDVRYLKGLKIAAIGPKTAGIWYDMGIRPDLMPAEYRAEAVAVCFKKHGIKGEKILIPRAARAREILPDELRNMGAEVDVVPVYRTMKPDSDTSRVRDLLIKKAIDMVTFTSSSTVENFADMFEKDGRDLQEWMTGVAVACIGPVTAGTARQNGFSVSLVAAEYTTEGLIDSIVQYFA